MAEWLKAAVLKTVELRGSEGSNPSCSDLERCESGRIGLPAKELFPKRVPGVRIPLFPYICEVGMPARFCIFGGVCRFLCIVFSKAIGFWRFYHEAIAQLDRASDCGSEGRQFEPA